MADALPKTLGELKQSGYIDKPIKDELRDNLAAKLQNHAPLFPGIFGYDDTVIPQIIHALLSKHDMIFLGLRGQAKTRMLRALPSLLDEYIPFIRGSEIGDDPFHPISRYAKDCLKEKQDATPIDWMHRDDRYHEKLATPDVTIADLIGDIDPIKAAKQHLDLSDERAIHYGLLPRANRGIFAINELPDLSPKIQVGLFNIMQERDVQIRGYSVRMPLDLCLVYTANPQDYTNRGRIVTPLKDRIGSEIRTHYPLTRETGMAITSQEVNLAHRDGREVVVLPFMKQIIEEIARAARASDDVEQESGVSARLSISCMENLLGSAERRALINNESVICPRPCDLPHVLPSISGKLELSYAGEEKGAARVGKTLIREAVRVVFSEYFDGEVCLPALAWFESDNQSLIVTDELPADQFLELTQPIPGLLEKVESSFPTIPLAQPEVLASAMEFLLEGLHAQEKLTKTELNGQQVYG